MKYNYFFDNEKKLRMSYKVLSTQHPKVASEDHKNLYCESILIQLVLMNHSLELIYDELLFPGEIKKEIGD